MIVVFECEDNHTDLLPTEYHVFKHLYNFFQGQNTRTNKRQKTLPKNSSNSEDRNFFFLDR